MGAEWPSFRDFDTGFVSGPLVRRRLDAQMVRTVSWRRPKATTCVVWLESRRPSCEHGTDEFAAGAYWTSMKRRVESDLGGLRHAMAIGVLG